MSACPTRREKGYDSGVLAHPVLPQAVRSIVVHVDAWGVEGGQAHADRLFRVERCYCWVVWSFCWAGCGAICAWGLGRGVSLERPVTAPVMPMNIQKSRMRSVTARVLARKVCVMSLVKLGTVVVMYRASPKGRVR